MSFQHKLTEVSGLFLTLIISPLAADLSFAVDQMEADEPGCFGEKGAYAQAYALFNCSMAAATVVGPLLSGGIQDRFGAPGVSLVMGLWCLSAALPVVSAYTYRPICYVLMVLGVLHRRRSGRGPYRTTHHPS